MHSVKFGTGHYVEVVPQSIAGWQSPPGLSALPHLPWAFRLPASCSLQAKLPHTNLSAHCATKGFQRLLSCDMHRTTMVGVYHDWEYSHRARQCIAILKSSAASWGWLMTLMPARLHATHAPWAVHSALRADTFQQRPNCY